jgi:hypothetical protein
MVAIQPEVVYTQKHSRLTGTGSDSGLTVTGAFDFVEIPVLAKLDLTRTKTPGFYVVVGPGFGLTTQAKLTDQKFGTTTLPDEDLKAENKVRSSDVGFIVGAGVTKGKVGVEVRYDAGLRNLNTDNDSTTFVVKERTATILVRWSFR